MTDPHNFDSRSTAHRLTQKLQPTLNLDNAAVTYRARRAETPPGVTIATHPRTWCHIIDLDDRVIEWHIAIDFGNSTTGSYVVDVADGTINTKYVPLDRAVPLLVSAINETTYHVLTTNAEK